MASETCPGRTPVRRARGTCTVTCLQVVGDASSAEPSGIALELNPPTKDAPALSVTIVPVLVLEHVEPFIRREQHENVGFTIHVVGVNAVRRLIGSGNLPGQSERIARPRRDSTTVRRKSWGNGGNTGSCSYVQDCDWVVFAMWANGVLQDSRHHLCPPPQPYQPQPTVRPYGSRWSGCAWTARWGVEVEQRVAERPAQRGTRSCGVVAAEKRLGGTVKARTRAEHYGSGEHRGNESGLRSFVERLVTRVAEPETPRDIGITDLAESAVGAPPGRAG